jgi:hypothetical protein
LQLKAVLGARVDPLTGVISIFPDPNSAELKFSAQDQDAAHLLGYVSGTIAKAILSDASATAGVMRVVPDISLVGRLADLSPIPEIQISGVELSRIGPVTEGEGAACLSVAVDLSGSSGNGGTQVSNFLADDGYASLISNRVIAAVCTYRWRTGDYPRTINWEPMQASYKHGDKEIPISVHWQVAQTDMSDENGNVLATTRVAGTYGYDPVKDRKVTYRTASGATDRIISEDHFITGGHISLTVGRVEHAESDAPVPAEITNQLTVPAELKNLIAHWPFRLASVGSPAPLEDPGAELHVAAMRKGVSQHLSRPFAYSITGALSRRLVNAQEGLLLSGGALN